MKPQSRKALNPSLAQALASAEAVLDNSYCPHSGLQVAAGLLLSDGRTITGVNYESDSYGLTLCAERAAIARAQVEGNLSDATALVLSARWKESPLRAQALTPCGACRQWLAELSRRLDRDLPVYSFWHGENKGIAASSMGLMPGAFALDDHQD